MDADVDAGFEISATGMDVLRRRYLAKDENGDVCETPEDLFCRVAEAVARGEKSELVYEELIDEFAGMMRRRDFLPNSPTLMNAGTEVGQLSACFVLPVDDSIESIFEQSRRTAIIFKSGGGVGLSFSRLRPAGDMVRTTRGVSSGPVSFMHVYDTTAEVVKQGGRRRGAMMALLRVDHPDIGAFIKAKEDLKSLTNMNTSVAVTDVFMAALRTGSSYDLINPRTSDVVGHAKSREVFDAMVDSAWRTGEPGVMFIDRINSVRPAPGLGEIETTNPCGEQPLLPNESCNLGSINLANMVSGGDFDYKRLVETVVSAVRFLDDVIEVNQFPFREIEANTKRTRKIGLGVMGWAEALVKLGIRYDSEQALEKAGDVMAEIAEAASRASLDLAKERGPYSACPREANLRHRNATRTTIAPTGSLSIIAGVTGGIEPMFAVGLTRQGILDGDKVFHDVNPLFVEMAEEGGFWSEDLAARVSSAKSIQDIEEIPEAVRRLFRTAHDISPEWHIKMQAAFQKHVDNAVSKTVNLPSTATRSDVERAFLLAYDLGCKGVTVYRDNARECQPMTTKKPNAIVFRRPRKRPDDLPGMTARVRTGCGNMFVTLTHHEGRPFDVFIKHGKSGVCADTQCEAIGRLASLAFRSDIDPLEVAKDLKGITCHSQSGFGPNRVLSCADAIGKAIQGLIDKMGLRVEGVVEPEPEVEPKPEVRDRSGGCPDCGAELVREGHCGVCRACGYTRCA